MTLTVLQTLFYILVLLKSEAFRHQQDNQEKDRIINQQKRIITDYRERLGHYLSTLSELLRGAVKVVIGFVDSGSRSFMFRQEGDIKRYMNSQPDNNHGDRFLK